VTSALRVTEIGEFGLIHRLTASLFHNAATAPIGVGDDAAVLEYNEGEQMVATTDALVEGVHFLCATTSFFDLGYKSVAVSMSDVAAMGAVPRHVLITLCIPNDAIVEDLEQLYRGIDAICRKYDAVVVGGDVARADQLVINVTVLGAVKRGRALLRSGARSGDLVFVTGALGGSAAGLHLLEHDGSVVVMPDERQRLLTMHLLPQPQVQAGQLLAASQLCTSCNDVSDGLASELTEICEASKCSIVVDRERIPIDSHVRNYAARCKCDPVEWALFGGEDYQLVGSVDRMGAGRLDAQMQASGIPFHWIGHVDAPTADGPAVWLSERGARRKLTAHGYNHFRVQGDSGLQSNENRSDQASRDGWRC